MSGISALSTKPRDPVLDIARALAMVLVVFGHALEMYFDSRADHLKNPLAFEAWRAIYGFHIPAFYLIAGMARGNLRDKSPRHILREMATLLVFAYLIHVLGWCAQALGAAALGMPTDVGMLTEPLITGRSFFIVVMWFLVALAWIQGAAYLLVGRFPWWLKLAVIGGALWLNVTLTGGDNYFELKCIFPGLLFFLIGQGLQWRKFRPPMWAWLPLLPLAVWLVPFNRGCLFSYSSSCANGFGPIFVVMMVNGRSGFLPLFIATGLAGAIGLLSLARLLANAGRVGAALAWCGRHTIELLVANGVVLCMLEPHLRNHIADFPGTAWVFLIPAGLMLAQFAALPIYGPAVGWIWRKVDGGVKSIE